MRKLPKKLRSFFEGPLCLQEGWQHLILRQLRQLDRRTLIQPDTGVMENFASVAIKVYYCSRHL